jgi:polar amino acid transport system substrate-binding protein
LQVIRHAWKSTGVFSLPRLIPIACALALLGACASPPEDPEGTLDRVTGGVMRVGITESDPWTVLSGDEPAGIEVELVERFAAELDAEIEWTEASEQELFGALAAGSLDLVIGGLTSTNPNSMEGTFTHPFHTSTVTIGVPAGMSADDIAGLEVAVERGTEAAGLLRKTDARPVYVDDIAAAKGTPAAVDDWLLADMGLHPSGTNLVESDHVMAVRHGENGFLVELEKFLLEDPETIEDLLDAVTL